MPNNDRAKQFMPFDALKGFKEEIKKRNKVVVKKKVLSEDDLAELERKIKLIEVGHIVTLIYFDEQDYIKVSGVVSKIDFESKMIKIVKTKIDISKIIDIEIEERTIYDI